MTRVSDYEILPPIGKGGIGEMYRARDRSVIKSRSEHGTEVREEADL